MTSVSFVESSGKPAELAGAAVRESSRNSVFTVTVLGALPEVAAASEAGRAVCAARAETPSLWASLSTCALNSMMRSLSPALRALMKSPTCSICTHRFARSMIRSSSRLPNTRPYAVITALRCVSSSLANTHARSRAGSLICISCQFVIAVIEEPE